MSDRVGERTPREDSDGFHDPDARHDPLCESIGVGVSSEGIEDYTQCHRDAVGLYRMEGHHGGETNNWLCEECKDRFEIIEELESVNEEDQ